MSKVQPAQGSADDGPRESELTLADMVGELRKLLADQEAGKRIDTLFALWKSHIEKRATHAELFTAASERAFKLRIFTSGGIVLLVLLAGWQKIITGEAVVGLMGGCLGYLWGATKGASRE